MLDSNSIILNPNVATLDPDGVILESNAAILNLDGAMLAPDDAILDWITDALAEKSPLFHSIW